MKSVGIVLAAIAVVAIIAMGIGQAAPLGAAASPSALASAEASLTPDPSTMVEPSAPAASMTPMPEAPISAVNEVDGIRVTLELDRDRIAYGERAWATVTVLNIGQDDVHWGHSGTCDFAASVLVTSSDPFNLGYGRDWGGELGVLKLVTLATQDETRAPGDPVAGFTPESWVDFDGNLGCTSDLVPDVIPPGRAETYRAAWDGEGVYDLPIPPDDYLVESVFSYFKRGSPPDYAFTGPTKTVVVDLPLVVDTAGVDYLGPGEAVDRVLESQAFLEELESAPRVGRWSSSTLHFEDGTWTMTLYLGNPEEAIVATVDARSGQVMDVVLDEDPGDPIF